MSSLMKSHEHHHVTLKRHTKKTSFPLGLPYFKDTGTPLVPGIG